MEIGKVNNLEILRFASSGAYLGDSEGNDILLPGQYLNDEMREGDSLDVYIYRDSEDRLVSTTERPLIELNGYAYLRVKEVTFFGAFMDWGLEKDLMIPFKEQAKKLEEGKTYLTCLLLDDVTNRLFGSTKLNRHIEKCEEEFDPETPVELLIGERTDLGIKVMVNNRYQGMIFENDLSRFVKRGQLTIGYVRKTREDGRLDVRLDLEGRLKISESAQRLLDILKVKKQLSIHDKSDPDTIRETVGMSKKTFKQAVGSLYKERLISLGDEKITLIED